MIMTPEGSFFPNFYPKANPRSSSLASQFT